MKTYKFLVVIAALTLVAAACGPAATPTPAPPAPTEPPTQPAAPTEAPTPTEAKPQVEWTGDLVIAKADEPNSIDPHVHDGFYSVRVQGAVYEALVDMYWDPDEEELVLAPLLAESWEISEDGLVYTFHLRKDVKFHDGTPFTAEAVKVTFDRNKAMAMRASWQVKPIDKIETPDDYTVILTLTEPFTPFLMAIARAFIMNPKLIKEQDEGDNAQAYFNEHMNGTGPYKFVRWDRESIIELVKNDDYWRGWEGKHFERIILRHVPERVTQRLLIEKGEVDIALQPSFEDAKDLMGIEGDGITVLNEPVLKLFVIEMKLRPPLDDKKVRQALAYSFPYDEAIEGLAAGFASRNNGPIPKELMGYTEEGVIKYEYSLEKAKQLLDEAGWKDTDGDGIRDKDGEPLSLEAWNYAGLAFEEEAEVLWQAKLKEIGIELKVVKQTSPATFMTASYDYDAPLDMIAMVLTSFVPDPDDYIRKRFHTDHWEGLNASFYGDEETDAMINKAGAMPDGPERKKIYEDLYRQINQDAPHIWVWHERKVWLLRDDLKGYVHNPLDSAREFQSYYNMYREE